jgi:hypothetical protein
MTRRYVKLERVIDGLPGVGLASIQMTAAGRSSVPDRFTRPKPKRTYDRA